MSSGSGGPLNKKKEQPLKDFLHIGLYSRDLPDLPDPVEMLPPSFMAVM